MATATAPHPDLVRLRFYEMEQVATLGEDAPDESVGWTPLPGPQTRAFESDANIIGYGGAAGGGKSAFTLGLAVTKHRRSIIFRRELDQVRDLWAKLGDICGVHGRSNENLLVWRDLPGDRTVRLAGCKNESDWRKFQGHENDLHAFDEATQFSEFQVRTLIAWNRTTIPGQLCQVVLGFNPPTTAEGQWVIDFFAPWLDPKHPDPAEPGELRWYAVIDGKDIEQPDGTPFIHNGETITPLSRTFIPARLEDNPILEATGYRSTLQNVPEPLRSQLLYGDFTVGIEDDEWQVIPTAWVREAQQRWEDDKDLDIPLTAIGVDVAQGGRDSTALARRYGHWCDEVELIPGSTIPDADANARIIETALTEEEHAYAAIDIDGLGASTYFLLAPKQGTKVRAYAGSALTIWRDKARVLDFFNTRAAAYWHLRELLDPAREQPIALPPGRKVLAGLTAPHWFKSGDKVQLEKKDDIKARLGYSPDEADAIVMAYWTDPSAGFAQAIGKGTSARLHNAPGMTRAKPHPAQRWKGRRG